MNDNDINKDGFGDGFDDFDSMPQGENTEHNNLDKDLEAILSTDRIAKNQILHIGINPRDEVNKNLVNKLKDIDGNDLPPIHLGYTDKELWVNGNNLQYQIFLCDGEHRYKSREEKDFLKCEIKYYDTELEIHRDAVKFNLHGDRLKDSEIEKIIYLEMAEFYRNNLNNFEEEPVYNQYAKLYECSRATIKKSCFKYILEVKFKNSRHEAKTNLVPKKIIEIIWRIIKGPKQELLTFFDSFAEILMDTKDLDTVREVAKLYTEGLIKTYQEYLERKQSQSKSAIFEEPKITPPEDLDVTTKHEHVIATAEPAVTETKEVFNLSLFTNKMVKDIDSHKRTAKDFEKMEDSKKTVSLPSLQELDELEASTKSYIKYFRNKHSEKVKAIKQENASKAS